MVLAFGMLKPGIGMSAAEASLKTMDTHLESEFPQDNAGRSVALSPMSNADLGVINYLQFMLAGGLMMGV